MQQESVPGGLVVTNLPAIAEDVGSKPGPGRLHMWRGNSVCALQLLSPCSGVHEPGLLKPALSLCPATKAAAAMRSLAHCGYGAAPLAQLEKDCAQQRPSAARNNTINFKRCAIGKLVQLYHSRSDLWLQFLKAKPLTSGWGRLNESQNQTPQHSMKGWLNSKCASFSICLSISPFIHTAPTDLWGDVWSDI